MLPALNAVGIPVLDCGTVHSSTLPRLGIGLLPWHGEGACVLFSLHHEHHSDSRLFVYKCETFLSLCVCLRVHAPVCRWMWRPWDTEYCSSRPIYLFPCCWGKVFPLELADSGCEFQAPTCFQLSNAGITSRYDPAFFFFFFRAFWRSNSCGKRFTDRAVSLFPHGNMKSELACPRRHIFSRAGGCPNALQHSLLYPGSGSFSVAMIKVTCLRKGLF